jgi:hypothetical protein
MPMAPMWPLSHLLLDVNHFIAVVDAIAHIDIKPPSLTKQGFVAGSAAAVAVAGRVALRIRLRFQNHAPQQLAIRQPGVSPTGSR